MKNATITRLRSPLRHGVGLEHSEASGVGYNGITLQNQSAQLPESGFGESSSPGGHFLQMRLIDIISISQGL